MARELEEPPGERGLGLPEAIRGCDALCWARDTSVMSIITGNIEQTVQGRDGS